MSAQQPSCPKGIIQWQHGKYHKASNGSLVLNPFAVDGRQLMSDPCTYGNAVYTRYHQQEIFKVRLPLYSICVRQLTFRRAAIRSPHQPLRQGHPPQPLRLGRRPHEPNVPGLQTATDASDPDAQPHRRRSHRRRPAIQYEQVKTRPSPRR